MKMNGLIDSVKCYLNIMFSNAIINLNDKEFVEVMKGNNGHRTMIAIAAL